MVTPACVCARGGDVTRATAVRDAQRAWPDDQLAGVGELMSARSHVRDSAVTSAR